MPTERTPRQQLDFLIGRYTPEIAALARGMVARLRKRLPHAVEFVYDKSNSLVIGFGPNERPSDAIISVVVFPRWALLYFLQGASLPDPESRLKGKGRIGRHLVLHEAATMDEPAVSVLMDEALALAEVPFDSKQPRKILIRTVSVKRPRPRRPA